VSEKPPWPACGRSRLGAAHQIAFADDTEQLAVRSDHRYAADAGIEQNAGDVLDTRSGPTVMTFVTITSAAYMARSMFI
jgi:hypothetical protein